VFKDGLKNVFLKIKRSISAYQRNASGRPGLSYSFSSVAWRLMIGVTLDFNRESLDSDHTRRIYERMFEHHGVEKNRVSRSDLSIGKALYPFSEDNFLF